MLYTTKTLRNKYGYVLPKGTKVERMPNGRQWYVHRGCIDTLCEEDPWNKELDEMFKGLV